MYQYLCNDCGAYGPGVKVWDEAVQSKADHAAESGHSDIEIHETTEGGGYEVIEAGDGTQLPDRADEE